MTRKVKPVNFSTIKDHDKELLAYVEKKGNFSAYVKKLIYTDMVSGGAVENMEIIRRRNKDNEDYTIDM